MKNNKIIVFSLFLLFSLKSFGGANTPFPIAPPMISYWAQCWATVTATTLGPKAQMSINQIKTTFDTALSIPLQKTIDLSTQRIVEAHTNSSANIIKTLAINYSNQAESKHKMQMDMMDGELAFMQSLAESEIMHENKGFFSDSNGLDGNIDTNSDSFNYAKTLCTRNKIMKQVSSSEKQIEKSNEIAKNSKKTETDNSQILSVEGFQNEIQKNHFEKYCTEEYYDSNLCDEPSEYPLGDISATKFLFPDGNGMIDVNENGMFKTNLTYNEKEQEIARDFIRNIIFYNPTRKPTIEEEKNNSKSEFILAYKRKYSALNIANYSFELAYSNRIPKTLSQSGMSLSTYDLYRYQMENTFNPDSKLSIQNSKKKGVEFMIYSAMLVENKLELERSLQQERIENLISLINAARINRNDNLIELESNR